MPRPKTVLLAPDKFKGCLTAIEVCSELRAGLVSNTRALEVVQSPVADGGDGTLAAALTSGFDARAVPAADPLGEPNSTRIGIRGRVAVIELAEICGLARLPNDQPRSMQATTYGVGLAMAAAIESGCRDLVVGVGGSASTDGGMGAAVALGARILDGSGAPVRHGGAGLAAVSTVDFAAMSALLVGVRITVATDVSSPLTGAHGAAHVFAAQKGANSDQVRELDAGLAHWAATLRAATGVDVRVVPGVGAAGGFAAPFLATRTARLASGAQVVLDLTDAGAAIGAADVVVTGEGRWDAQTGTGKAPHAVVEAALAAGKPVIAVAGSFSEDADLDGVSESYSLTDLAGPDRDPLRDARTLLREIGAQIGREQLRR